MKSADRNVYATYRCPGVSRATRRTFLTGVLAFGGATLSGLAQMAFAQSDRKLTPIGEMRSKNGKLHFVMKVLDEMRLLPAGSTITSDGIALPARRARLRYFEGRDSDGNVWPLPAAPGVSRSPQPGPTLRASIGEQVEITYLNHTSDNFAESFDHAEKGTEEGCDIAVTLKGVAEDKIYPTQAGDGFPNCFHGSSTTNLHFHGTHVTPDGLGDNVLLQLRPDPTVGEAMAQADFTSIFTAGPPTSWNELPQSWRDTQLKLLKDYDDNAVFNGKKGTPGNPALPLHMQLRPQTDERIAKGLWPQYQIGAYPFCFRLTRYVVDSAGKPNVEMGQCPGTHWYHAHKHGSTALNVYHGMAGVFIIEGDYDTALDNFDKRLKQTEKVLVVQQFSEIANLVSRRQHPGLFVNGKRNPTVSMQPGEIQLWRLVNASVKAVTTWRGFQAVGSSAPEVRQIAQDGVQFSFANYQSQPILRSTTPRSRATFAPGNRLDILVKAPMTAGNYVLQVEDTARNSDPVPHDLLTLVVEGTSISPAMNFPSSKEEYPAFPPFLNDIKSSDIHKPIRTLDFGWKHGRVRPGFGDTPAGTSNSPHFTINGEQFNGEQYDQTMIVGDVEEWVLTNSTARIAHPFHIHVNPFQIVEIYDPNATEKLYNPEGDFVWQDVIAIPPAKIDATGTLVLDPVTKKAADPGYVRIRHRFVDFTGSYVLHCHMLGHEDRGMMQLIRVVTEQEAKLAPPKMPHH